MPPKVYGEPSITEKNQKAKYNQWLLAINPFKPYLEYKNSSTKTINSLYKIVMKEIGELGTVKSFSIAFERGPLAWANKYTEMISDGNSGLFY